MLRERRKLFSTAPDSNATQSGLDRDIHPSAGGGIVIREVGIVVVFDELGIEANF